MRALFFVMFAGAAIAAPAVKWGNVPLSFEPNLGQASTDVRYLARGSSYTLYLASGEVVLAGGNQSPLRTKLSGANPSARIVGEAPQTSISNYFLGNDRSKWRTSVPNYGRVRYAGVYPGIDLAYYGKDGYLEYDWIVSPGADPRKIRIIFEKPDKLRIDKNGDLVIGIGKNEYRHKRPVVYQEAAGKRVAVAGGWVLRGREASFRVGAYDPAKDLVIDPPLIYSTYLGGNGADYANAIAVDPYGNTYIAGSTASTNFPTTNPVQGALKGVEDVFVTKLSPDGSAKIYSTYLGGGGPDEGKGIAVDNQGYVYVTGSSGSFDFPMEGAVQPTWGGSGDAFLAKLNPAGSALVYSTYLGGNAIDSGTGAAVDPAGNAYIVGITFSANFPTKYPFQAAKGAQQDAFVAKINPGGTAWVYVTYLGGSNVDEGYGIAVDASGNAYVTGYTASTNFPLQSPLQSSNNTSVDAFVTKLNPAGSALVYSTYLGGTGTDYGTAIAVDLSGSAYVTGLSESEDFPVVNAIDGALGSHAVDDAFVAKFTPSGSALIYSTYIGGGSEDGAYAIAVDQAGNAYITGRTNSFDFPLVNPIQATRYAFDIFVTEVNASGSALVFSTFVGGIASGSEAGRAIAVDQVGNIHVAGETSATDFPVLKAIQTANGGGSNDAFVLLLGNTSPSSGTGSLAASPSSLRFGSTSGGAIHTGSQTVVVQASAGLVWTASPSQGFISVSPGFGTGTGSFTVGIVPGALPASGSVSGMVTVSGFGVTPVIVAVTATIVSTTGIIGSFDTPANNTAGAAGSIAVTGWALDDIAITKVDIWREKIGAEATQSNGLVYIGDAVLVPGARPDVAAAHPTLPMNYRAGWGYLMLTNFLPNSNGTAGYGNGTYKLHAIAHSATGKTLDLGTRTITCDNAHATKPFGAIDTPGQGETISGAAYVNYGWALTHQPNQIPTDGSTIQVVVDGQAIGHPVYNNFRNDIATLFPGYANSQGAVGYFNLNRTAMSNGLHTIAWIVTDNAGNADGIGSRYFSVLNSSSSSPGAPERTAEPPRDLQKMTQRRYVVETPELGRVKLEVGATEGYLLANGERQPLPVGSTLKDGVFYWGLGPGFLGEYTLVFTRPGAPDVRVAVRVVPMQ